MLRERREGGGGSGFLDRGFKCVMGVPLLILPDYLLPNFSQSPP